MTGYNTPETEAKILGVGADACISKPFDKDILFGYIGLVPTADKRDNLAVGGLDQHVM
jgi:CheY-like chemotaxis protein